MEQNGQRSQQHTERRILVASYATGLWPRFATLVRGSSRRIMTMKASVSSILEYQSDQPSMKPLRPLSFLLHPPMTKKTGPPHFSLAGSFHIRRVVSNGSRRHVGLRAPSASLFVG
jgi:hypothetical protein